MQEIRPTSRKCHTRSQRRRANIFAIAGFLMSSLSACTGAPTSGSEPSLTVGEFLANPSPYINQTVTIRGLTKIDFEDTNIYAPPRTGQHACISLAVKSANYLFYKAHFNNRRASVRGKVIAPFCSPNTVCSWACNDGYGIIVDKISP